MVVWERLGQLTFKGPQLLQRTLNTTITALPVLPDTHTHTHTHTGILLSSNHYFKYSFISSLPINNVWFNLIFDSILQNVMPTSHSVLVLVDIATRLFKYSIYLGGQGGIHYG